MSLGISVKTISCLNINRPFVSHLFRSPHFQKNPLRKIFYEQVTADGVNLQNCNSFGFAHHVSLLQSDIQDTQLYYHEYHIINLIHSSLHIPVEVSNNEGTVARGATRLPPHIARYVLIAPTRVHACPRSHCQCQVHYFRLEIATLSKNTG